KPGLKPEGVDLCGAVVDWTTEKSSRKNVFQVRSLSGFVHLSLDVMTPERQDPCGKCEQLQVGCQIGIGIETHNHCVVGKHDNRRGAVEDLCVEREEQGDQDPNFWAPVFRMFSFHGLD
ncbi:rho GTPase-activating protein 15 isoform X1, partial [Tachysurus ichikawai]